MIPTTETAQEYYARTKDLAGFQERNTAERIARDQHILDTYRDTDRETELRNALAQGGRVFGTLDTGEIIRLHNTHNLYHVSNVTGAPSTPTVARLVGPLIVKHTTVADLTSPAI